MTQRHRLVFEMRDATHGLYDVRDKLGGYRSRLSGDLDIDLRRRFGSFMLLAIRNTVDLMGSLELLMDSRGDA